MKKIILVVLFALTMNIIHAQALMIDDIFKSAKCLSFDCFNSFINKQGFNYIKSSETDALDTYFYEAEEKEKKTGEADLVVFSLFKNKQFTSLRVKTADKAYYQRLYEELLKRGFTPVKSANGNTIVTTSYKSEKYKNVSLSISVSQNSLLGKTWTDYSFDFFTTL